MSSRVQKGGTLFRPVVKSRARTATPRQPSAAVGEQLRSESTLESSHEEDTLSLSTNIPTQDQQESSSREQLDANSFNRLSSVSQEHHVAPRRPTLPPAAGPSLIGIPLGPVRRSTPIVVESRKTANPRPVGSLSIANSNGADASTPVDLTLNSSSLGVGSTQVDRTVTALMDLNNNSHPSTDPPISSTVALADSNSAHTSSGGMEPPKDVPKGKVHRRKSQEGDSTKQRKRRKPGVQEGDDENAEEAVPTKQPRSRASSSTPRPRKRAPSPPPYDPDADPGEDIDPTTVTMASLCSDTGQGRVSKKAAEILSNHAAWKIKNREKRARMKIMMEAKKYGREEDEEAENADSRVPENSAAVDQSSATTSNTAAVTDDTGSGFDYSQDLATSRFNVQVRIGPNGETIIDENSLVVDRAEDDGTENYTHVVESDHTKFVNSGTYGKRYRGSRWSAEETELFYDALSQYGENYELIAYVLPGRDRKSCKNKFKVEDKRNHARINHCLDNSIPVDMKTLSRMTGKDFSGPVPEIRASTPMPLVPPTEDELAEDPQTQTVKKRSRSKSHGLDNGLVVIGDAETFE